MKHWILAALVAICGISAAAQSRTGKVNFANSGAAAAQENFQVGLAQLHNFQYEQAERLFRQAEASDPNFAMAYWGETLTHVHPLWNYEDLAGARAVLQKLRLQQTSAPARLVRSGKRNTSTALKCCSATGIATRATSITLMLSDCYMNTTPRM